MSPPVRRRLVTGVALAVVLLESLGYYGARTSFLPYASERLGLPLANGSGLLGVASVAGLVAALMAGPIGASIGPLPTVALGLGLGAAGGTVLALADSAGGAGLGLVALVASPGLCLGPLYAALVREWGAGRPAGRVAVLLGAYGLLNVAALAAAPLSALVGRTSDNAVTAAPFFLVAGTGVVTAVVIAALAFAQRQPPRGPDDRRLPARGLLVNGLAVLLGAPTLPGIVGVGSAVILGVAGISALLAAWPLQAWANEVASEVPAG